MGFQIVDPASLLYSIALKLTFESGMDYLRLTARRPFLAFDLVV